MVHRSTDRDARRGHAPSTSDIPMPPGDARLRAKLLKLRMLSAMKRWRYDVYGGKKPMAADAGYISPSAAANSIFSLIARKAAPRWLILFF